MYKDDMKTWPGTAFWRCRSMSGVSSAAVGLL